MTKKGLLIISMLCVVVLTLTGCVVAPASPEVPADAPSMETSDGADLF